MKNADLPASPADSEYFEEPAHTGLTKREAFAMVVIQGNLAAFHDRDVSDFGDIAHDCVMFADALLEELEK